MAPATESIMGSLPPAKAGVGSAVNDTTREVGGALGVAILGSRAGLAATAAASIDRAGQRRLCRRRPRGRPRLHRRRRRRVPQASGQFPAQAAQVLATAREAYVSAMGPAMLVGAAFIALGALVVLFFLPARSTEEAAELELEAELEPEVELEVHLRTGATTGVAGAEI